MPDYSVKLVITNEETKKDIMFETTVGEETAREVLNAYTSTTGSFPFLTLDDIR